MTQLYQTFENNAVEAIAELCQVPLHKKKVDINGKKMKFDGINFNEKIVVEAKNFRNSDYFPSGKMSTMNDYIWRMEKLEHFDGNHWKKIFVCGDLEFLNLYIQKFESWLGRTEYYFLSNRGLTKIR